MTENGKRLFCFGLGYSAVRVCRLLMADGWSVAGTCRSDSRRAELSAVGIDAKIFDSNSPLADADQHLSRVSHVLSSVPPPRNGDDGEGDPVLALHGSLLRAAKHLQWIGYLSTTGVYGDAGGGFVDEASPINPSSERGHQRVVAEAGWLSMGAHVFRLAGI